LARSRFQPFAGHFYVAEFQNLVRVHSFGWRDGADGITGQIGPAAAGAHVVLVTVGDGVAREGALDVIDGDGAGGDRRRERDQSRSDSAKFLLRSNEGRKGASVRISIERTVCASAFQAYDEGSIPFTRSNLLKHLAAICRKFAIFGFRSRRA
jgi:hypothetical protein